MSGGGGGVAHPPRLGRDAREFPRRASALGFGSLNGRRARQILHQTRPREELPHVDDPLGRCPVGDDPCVDGGSPQPQTPPYRPLGAKAVD
eukprot:4785558-Alexandrium_andersonii.AAC.1